MYNISRLRSVITHASSRGETMQLDFINNREMKRINTIVAMLVLIVGTVNAQTKFGIKTEVGISQASSIETAYATGETDEIFYGLETGQRSNAYSIGLSAKHTVSFIHLSTDVLMTKFTKSFDVQDFGLDGGIGGAYNQSHTQLDIPLKIGLAAKNFNIAVGPQFQYTLNKEDELAVLGNLVDRSRKFSTGYNLSVGYDFGPIFTDVSFYKNFGGEAEGIYLSGEKAKFKNRNQQFKFAVGFHF